MQDTREYRIKKIIGQVFWHGGQVFGGYVRDLLAGEKPKDLDVKFPDEKKALEFIGCLSRLGIVEIATKDEWGLDRGYYYRAKVYRVRLYYPTRYPVDLEKDPNKAWVDVDVVVGNPWVRPDLDINLLQIDRNGISVGVIGYSLVEILAHIRAKKARVLRTCTHGRWAKIRTFALQRKWELERVSDVDGGVLIW